MCQLHHTLMSANLMNLLERHEPDEPAGKTWTWWTYWNRLVLLSCFSFYYLRLADECALTACDFLDEATDVIAQADGHNNVGNEGDFLIVIQIALVPWWMCSYCLLFLDCNDVHHENTMADIADANTQAACDNQVTNEGNCLFVYLTHWLLHY